MFNIEQKVDDIIKSYEGYVPSQFRDKPKAMATIRLIIKVALASAILDQIAVAYSYDEASGKVLDIIAGNNFLDRNLPITASNIPFFQLPEYDDTPTPPATSFVGYTDYSTTTNYNSVFRRYSSTESLTTSTPDDVLKLVILFKVLMARSKGTMESIISLLDAVGLKNVISLYDGGNRTITYRVNTTNSLLANIIYNLGLLPRPIGIGSTLVVTAYPLGMFHLLEYGDNPLGYDFNSYGHTLNGRTWLKYGES